MVHIPASLLILFSVLCCQISESEAIVNGEKAQPGEFPFIVSLRNNSGNHYCGGSLVTLKHIVTAAHCIYDDNTIFFGGTPTKLNPQDIKVVVGTVSTKRTGDVYDVATYIVHPRHNIRSVLYMTFDVAVIVVKNEINTRNVKPISLSVTYPPDDTSATIAGWGYLSYEPRINATDLQKLTVKVQNKQKCVKEWYAKEYTATDVILQIRTEHVFCALPKITGSGTCLRDSGGPLIIDGKLAGIVLGGLPCARGIADLYTSIFGYRDFIDNVINSKSHRDVLY